MFTTLGVTLLMTGAKLMGARISRLITFPSIVSFAGGLLLVLPKEAQLITKKREIIVFRFIFMRSNVSFIRAKKWSGLQDPLHGFVLFHFNFDVFGLGRFAFLEMHLQHAVLELGTNFGSIGAIRQAKAPRETAVRSFHPMITFVLFFLLESSLS